MRKPPGRDGKVDSRKCFWQLEVYVTMYQLSCQGVGKRRKSEERKKHDWLTAAQANVWM